MHTHVKLRDSGNPPGLEGSTIVLAGCGIWLFFEVILGSELKKARKAGILKMSGSEISYFYWVKMRDTGIKFCRDYILTLLCTPPLY